MGAISDIQSWISEYRRLYQVTIAKFVTTPYYKGFTSAKDMPLFTSFGLLMKSWRNKINIFTKTKWMIENLSDKDLDAPNLVISKDYFSKIASEVRSTMDFNIYRNYIERGLEFVRIAHQFKENAENKVTFFYQGELHSILAIGGISMVLMVLHPYHLYVNFAWHVDKEKEYKAATPEEQVTAYYEFFTDPQWVPINQYVNRLVRDKKIPDLLEFLSKLEMQGNQTIADATTDQQIRDILTKFQDVRHPKTIIKILGNNAAKLFIDAYSPE